MKNIAYFIFLIAGLIAYTGCDDSKDDGQRGFSINATITGDAKNGYHCHLDHGGLVISHSKSLDGIERGYFSFYYTKEDESISDGTWLINNAYVSPIDVYDIIYPIIKEEAESKQITDNDSCAIPSFLSIGNGTNGYIDLNAAFATFNIEKGETVNGKVNIVFDLEQQEPDTLRLQLCYNPNIPKNWAKVSQVHRTISCDISSFASLREWNDSITVVVDYGDKDKRIKRKISKNDFLKPGQKRL